MKTERNFPRVTVTPKAEASLKKGHPWVYGEEITEETPDIENGALVDVFTKKGSYMGTGFYSASSKIRVRVLSNNANERFGRDFWARRVRYAVDYRRTVMGEDFCACRLIFGESDGFPGLTVDRFSGVLVAQVLSFGTEQVKDVIFDELYRYLTSLGEKVEGIFERNEAALRALEGLERYKGWYKPEVYGKTEKTVAEICENGVFYAVDFENGQKTGYFLDQKYNRRAVARLARGKRVLDCFTHTGSFALCAAKEGAGHVTAVDISQAALDMAKANAVRNRLDDRMDFLCTDVFDLLTDLSSSGKAPYDLIILDPPAFTKSRKTVGSAERGYRDINLRAMKVLPRGGYLATCSCSHFMENELFVKMLRRAAADAGVSLRQIEVRQQACDHPILWNVPETDYLKFYIFQIV